MIGPLYSSTRGKLGTNYLINPIFLHKTKKVGDVDFYPNGGEAHQPGCEDEDAFGIDCSHARAPVSTKVTNYHCKVNI